jgi:hypothetical protein
MEVEQNGEDYLRFNAEHEFEAIHREPTAASPSRRESSNRGSPRAFAGRPGGGGSQQSTVRHRNASNLSFSPSRALRMGLVIREA